MNASLTIVYWLDGDMYVGRLKELQENIRDAYHLTEVKDSLCRLIRKQLGLD